MAAATTCRRRRRIEHDPEELEPVFGKDHAQAKNIIALRARTAPFGI
jgi:hypothetical protein